MIAKHRIGTGGAGRQARWLALLAVLLVAAPVAQARSKRHHKRLIGHVHRASAKAPKAWSYLPAPAPAAAVVTPEPVAATPTPAPTPPSALPPANPRSVSVGATEFALTLSQRSVLAGDVRVQFDNSRAEDPHQLAVDGPDPEYWDFGEQAAGTVTQRTIALRPGTYVLFCPLPDHEALGMRATLTVR